jgi:adenosylhomocysteine nucleosidase
MQPASATHVVILTALDVEYAAVLAHLTGITTVAHPAGTLFEAGDVRGSACRVAVGLTGPGNTSAAVVAERAIATFAPQALFFVGIAGALDEDLALGDVVFATKVYAYHGGRADDAGFGATPDAWYPPHSLDQLAHHLARRAEWHGRLREPWTGRVHFRPIAAGEVVLNSATHPLRAQLRLHYADAAAIEMESAGAARAGQLNRSLPTLTIRGISDRADGDKYAGDTGGHQDRAMIGAPAFAAELAVHVPAAPPPPASPPPAAAEPGKVQNITAFGGLAVGAMDGDVHIHPHVSDSDRDSS